MPIGRLAGILPSAFLAAPGWTAGVSSTPDFDQEIDVKKVLESVGRAVGEDREGASDVRASAEEEFRFATGNDFTANVKRGERRVCRYRRHYGSNDMSDCRSASTRLCDRYFREENYCQ